MSDDESSHTSRDASSIRRRLLRLVPAPIRRNLLAKLLVMLVIGALVSGGLVVFMYSEISDGLDAQVESQVESDVTVQAAVYQNWLTERWSTLEALTDEDEFGHDSPTVVHQWLVANEPGVSDDVETIYVVDQASGDVIASEDSASIETNLYDRGFDESHTERRIFISDAPVDLGDGPVTLVGVRDGDRLLVGAIPVETSLIDTYAFDGTETTLRSFDGNRLLGTTTGDRVELPPTSEMGDGSVVNLGDDTIVGTRVIAHDDLTLEPVDSYDESTTVGTVLVTSVPAEEAFAIQNQITEDVMIAFGLAFVLLIGTAVVSMRSITGSVDRLSSRAQTISNGTLDVDMDSPRTDEIGRLYDSIREMRDSLKERLDLLEERETKLERSNEKLEHFAYVASHDLQEPLRMVSSYMDLIQLELDDELDDETEEYIEFAADGAERMKAMIDGLLAYSRVQTRASPFEPVDTEDVVETTLSDLQLRIDDGDASVSVGSLPDVVADPNQLGQVFQNLIKNAIDHGGNGVEIDITGTTKEDATEFAVSDSGPGIPPDRRDDVFDIFDTGVDSDGTGIGLAVVQEIVERHEGEIWMSSTVGDGTTFFFTIPADLDA
ncbi:MAG: sensor histidine kinase [Natronomonas sp.]